MPWGFSIYFSIHCTLCHMTKAKHARLIEKYVQSLMIELISIVGMIFKKSSLVEVGTKYVYDKYLSRWSQKKQTAHANDSIEMFKLGKIKTRHDDKWPWKKMLDVGLQVAIQKMLSK